jgi:xylan 1,4-beta-xylosidase
MKRIGIVLASLLVLPTTRAAFASEARFAWFAYRGVEAGPKPPPGTYRNPIIAGFHPDPSIVRVGDFFYLFHSSFAWFPGIPVWRSRDLVHWHRLGNAIDRPGQLDFGRLGLSRGVFAPGVAWHDGLFYLVGTCVDCGGNFVMTARDAAGPWSDPTWLREVEGIDPSLFFDDDGSAWLVNNRAPAGPPRYDGHRAIWLQRFDPVARKVTGAARMIVDGGVDPATKPVWIEGPHLFKHGGHYYLSAAEGGTSVNHSQVVFRAERLDGAFTPAPPGVNPILTQRDLDPARPSPITSAGHADLVQLADGSWWAVFLATRPYAGDLYNIGRETFLLPVAWRDGWPIILRHGVAIPRFVHLPALPSDAAPPTSGSFSYRDDFNDMWRLDPAWLAIRGPAAVAPVGKGLGLTPGAVLGSAGRPAFIGRRQMHDDATVTTALRFAPGAGERAGLAAVQSDDALLTLAVARAAHGIVVRVARRDTKDDPATGRVVASRALPAGRGPVLLRIHLVAGRADFAVARGGRWYRVASGVDATNLSTARAGGFTGTVIGPFADRTGG